MKLIIKIISNLLLLLVLTINVKLYADDLPKVEKLSYGEYKLILSEKQQSAVEDYLKENPQMRLMLTDEATINLKDDIEYYMNEGTMQYQYAAWGDFNIDTYTDLLLIFINEELKDNEYHPKGYSHHFVIFENDYEDNYHPRLVHINRNGVIDGILYHKDINLIEFAGFEVAAGGIEWTGTDYIIDELMGD